MPSTDSGPTWIRTPWPAPDLSRRPPGLRRARPTLALIVALLAGGRADAQTFGRWSWEGSLKAGQHTVQNSLGDTELRGFNQRDLRLWLGVRGFVLHPNFARFQVNLDTVFSRSGAGLAAGNRRWGGDARLRLFPVGKYRLNLTASRHSYGYTDVVGEDPLTLLGVPETSTGVGLQFRIAQGRLRGLSAGLHRHRLSFSGPDARPEDREDAFVNWSSAGRRYQRHFRLARRYRKFGTVDFSNEDLRATFEQRSQPGAPWRWDSATVGFLRENGPSTSTTSFASLRTRQVFQRTVRGADVVQIRYVGGYGRGGLNPGVQSHSLSSRYRWRTGPQFEIAPVAGYELQLGGDASVRSPNVGVHAIWTGQSYPLEPQVNASLSIARRSYENVQGSASDTSLVMGLVASAAHGHESRGFRTRLDVAVNRNQLRTAGLHRPELPDLGVSLTGLGGQDSVWGRLTLSRRWTAFSLNGYSEAERSTSSQENVQTFSTRSLRHNLQVAYRGLSLAGGLTSARHTTGGGEQRLEMWSVQFTWRALRMLSLWGNYRKDDRQVAFAPDLDGDRYEAGTDLAFGAFVLTGRVFHVRESVLGLPERVSNGFQVELSRRFGGWLPFVTGGPGRGVIK